MARKFLALTLLIVPLAFAACGDDEETSTESAATSTESTTGAASSGGGETISIGETEYALDPSDVSAAAGTVSFDVSNDGEIPHNLEVEGDGVEEVTETIEPGAKATLSVDLPAGTYEIYCSIADHQEQGMEGTLTVE